LAVAVAVEAAMAGVAATKVAASAARQTFKRILVPHYQNEEARLHPHAFTSFECLWFAENLPCS
jgi:hypothetical protein